MPHAEQMVSKAGFVYTYVAKLVTEMYPGSFRMVEDLIFVSKPAGMLTE